MTRLLIGLLILAAIVFLLNWFVKTPPKQAARVLGRAGLGIAIGLLVFLAATGRLNWLYALIGALVPLAYRAMGLLGLVPLIQRLLHLKQTAQNARGAAPGASSAVQTRFLRMTLEHDTGVMSGEVLEGQFKGARLHELTLEQLVALLAECRASDESSAALLESYLERLHGADWRERASASAGRARVDGRMSREEAYEVLGLEVGADKQAITDAHRRLMQKLHPDRGGSTYLAAKLNQAKDVLLGH